MNLWFADISRHRCVRFHHVRLRQTRHRARRRCSSGGRSHAVCQFVHVAQRRPLSGHASRAGFRPVSGRRTIRCPSTLRGSSVRRCTVYSRIIRPCTIRILSVRRPSSRTSIPVIGFMRMTVKCENTTFEH